MLLLRFFHYQLPLWKKKIGSSHTSLPEKLQFIDPTKRTQPRPHLHANNCQDAFSCRSLCSPRARHGPEDCRRPQLPALDDGARRPQGVRRRRRRLQEAPGRLAPEAEGRQGPLEARAGVGQRGGHQRGPQREPDARAAAGEDEEGGRGDAQGRHEHARRPVKCGCWEQKQRRRFPCLDGYGSGNDL